MRPLFLMATIRTIALVVFVALCLALILPWFILYTIFSGSPELMYHAAMIGVRVGVRLAGIRVRVEGAENIPAGVCVFVANHVSNLDPPAVVPTIPRRIALLAKKEVFRIPILSRAMRLAAFVAVDRADPESAAASLLEAVEHLRNGVSYLVFPEGTRSPDGRLRPFKKGSFVMAIQAGVPVVPISVIGTQKLMRKGEWAVRPGEVVVRFGPAVDASSLTMDQRGELLARTEALVAEGLPEDQRPLESSRGNG